MHTSMNQFLWKSNISLIQWFQEIHKRSGGVTTQSINFDLKSNGDMAKSVDAMDLIGLSFGMILTMCVKSRIPNLIRHF